MNISFALLWQLTLLTVRDPKQAAQRVLAADIGREATWLILVLSGIASAIILALVFLVVPIPPEGLSLPDGSQLTDGVEYSAIGQGVTSILAALLIATGITFIGRLLGGQGDFNRLLTLVAILEMVMVVVQALMLVIVALLPLVGILAIVGAVVVFFRGLAHFTQVGHGFDGLGRAIATMLLTIFALGLILSVIVPTPQPV